LFDEIELFKFHQILLKDIKMVVSHISLLAFNLVSLWLLIGSFHHSQKLIFPVILGTLMTVENIQSDKQIKSIKLAVSNRV